MTWRLLVALGGSGMLLFTPAMAAAQEGHVACVGDSITQGVGASSPSTSYPSVLGNLLGATHAVQNDGHSGATMLASGDLPYRSTGELGASRAWTSAGGDVVIQLGTNDSKPANWAKKAAFLGDCKALVAEYRALPGAPRVWLNRIPPATARACCSIDSGVIASEILPLLDQCASESGISTIDVHSAMNGHPEYLPDGVHPNDTGMALIAQTVATALAARPSVTLEARAEGTVEPVVVSLKATPAAAYGRVERVRFYDARTVVGEVTAAPWSLERRDVPKGTHAYRAEVVETAGRTASSPVTSIEVAERPVDPGSRDAGADTGGGLPSDAGTAGPRDVNAARDAGPGGSSPGGPSSPTTSSGQTGRVPPSAPAAEDSGGCAASTRSELAGGSVVVALAAAVGAWARRGRRRPA